MTDRILFHCDCNSFYASVEETFHPVYKAVPMAVAGDPENRRGIILAKNQLAKGYGIQTAETIRSAKQKCPELRLCAPRWRAYGNFSRRINAIYEQYTDLVERFSIDESFLDVTGSLHLFGGDAAALAHEIRQRVEQEIGVTISVGVSWNKIFAKFGSDLKKLNAVTVITRGNYQQIVWPLPVGDLFMVGRTTAAALQSYSIRTIGDLARADADFLRGRFGKFGDMLRLYANGLDNSPVARAGEHGLPKSVGNGLTFRRDLLTLEDIQTGVTALADTVAGRLRRAGLKCCTVQVTIKDTALKSIQRQQPAKAPTWLAADLAATALEIIQTNWQIGRPIRLLTVTAQNLLPASDATGQLSFFDSSEDMKTQKNEKLERTMDAIRGKYGRHSIQHGNVLQNDLGISDHEEAEKDEEEEETEGT